jgi:glycosyltransferase involved in cell wall biosynthesis
MIKVDLYWDLRATIPERYTGVGQHVIEVVNRLWQHDEIDLRILLADDQAKLWESQSKVFRWQKIPVVHLHYSNKAYRLIYGCTSWFSLQKICAGRDLVYSPMEMILNTGHISFVNTIHGIPCFEKGVPISKYHSFSCWMERFKQRYFFRRCYQLCSMSFSVSDYLSRQLVQDFNFRAEHLYAVYNGAADHFYDLPEDCADDPPKVESLRLLSVGGANVFDGVHDLLHIAKALLYLMPSAKLYIAGDRHEDPWCAELQSLPNVVWLGFLKTNRIAEEMCRANALIYVPAVESFGIVGVEAMAVGLPVLAKYSEALSDVLDDAAIWIEPRDQTQVLMAIRSVTEDKDFCKTQIAKGRKRAAHYRWSHVADRVIEGFKHTLEKCT